MQLEGDCVDAEEGYQREGYDEQFSHGSAVPDTKTSASFLDSIICRSAVMGQVGGDSVFRRFWGTG